MDPRSENEASKDPAVEHKHKLPIDEREFEGEYRTFYL